MNKTLEGKANRKNGIKRLIFSAVGFLLQVLWVIFIMTRVSIYAQWATLGMNILALLVAIAIYSQDKTSSLKVPWIMLIMALPFFGVTLYLLVGTSMSTRKMRERYKDADNIIFPSLKQDPDTEKALREYDEGIAGISTYLRNYGRYPVYRDTDVTFYPESVPALEAQKADLRKAEKFIFMEYHAIEDKEAWWGILDILKEKAKGGVEIRIFYDDIGSIGFINMDFVKQMEELGIKCRVFNPVSPLFRLFMNNRDHRKMTIIDGKIGFTGGFNLANEYFGLTEPYGKWLDTGIRLEGGAVKSMTALFLEMWNASNKKADDPISPEKYIEDQPYEEKAKGYVQPYGNNPIEEERLAENVYISLIENAKRYCYFTTPYLIITDEMCHAIGLAAKRGVDIRIITPGIPDKRIVYSVTRSYYYQLVKNGVRIYEYTPGFCHAKQCVSDDRIAACGTINLDYRSLYHHFENGCIFADCSAVDDVKKDFEDLFPQCNEVTEKYSDKRFAVLRLGQQILRLFAALL